MKRLLFAFFLSISSVLTVQAQIHLRYNHAGYHPNRIITLVAMSESSLEGKPWKLLSSGDSITSGKLSRHKTSQGDHTPFLYNYEVTLPALQVQGEYNFVLEESTISFEVSEKPYAKYVNSVVRYLRQQRSGTPEALDHLPGHFEDSIAKIWTKGSGEQEWQSTSRKANVIGGWYDAGDYLKFTLTNAYTVYNLLRAYEANPEIFQTKNYANGPYSDLLDEAKFGLDYLERCLVDDSTFIIQVGNEVDHQQGNRLPHLDKNAGNRGAYSAMSKPQLAFCAADFALASHIFKTDSTLSKRYLALAIKLFDLAEKSTTSAWYQKDHEVFYDDKNPLDNLLLAASELARVSDNPYYLKQVKHYVFEAKQGYWAAWGDYHLQAQLN